MRADGQGWGGEGGVVDRGKCVCFVACVCVNCPSSARRAFLGIPSLLLGPQPSASLLRPVVSPSRSDEHAMTDDSSYTYVVTAQKPSSVTHAVTGKFTGADDLNLIVAKGTYLELSSISDEGLVPILEIPLYGRVASMELYAPSNDKDGQQLLLILTERYDICVLKYDAEARVLTTHASGNVRDVIGRPTEGGQIGVVDPSSLLIGLHLYDGLLKIIPLNPSGKVLEAFNARLEELQIIDMTFLHGTTYPTACILYEDTKQRRHVKTYIVKCHSQELLEGPWNQPNVESGASMLVAVPSPIGGVLILGQQTITYHNGDTSMSLSTPSVVWRATGKIDASGSRILLGDHLGGLWILVLTAQNDSLQGLDIDKLGETSCASTICYLDSGFVHVGSAFGDSHLVRLLEEKSPTSNSYLECVESFSNIGPIVDFCVVDLENQGRGQVVTCSGAFKDGSLRVIRNGIGISEQAAIDIGGIKGLWALRPALDAPYDKFLVMSFRSETRVLGLEDETMEEVEVDAFQGDQQTLVCGNMLGTNIVQVSPASVNIVDGGTLSLVTKWSPDGEARIKVAAVNTESALVTMGGGLLVLLGLDGASLKETATLSLNNEVACIDISPLGDGPAKLAAVGMWNDMTVRVLKLPTLEQIHQCSLASETIPRSLLLTSFDGVARLLVGLGDGSLIRFVCDETSGNLTNRKAIAVGTQPISLRTFRSKKTQHVFAASDRPVVIYSNNGKIHYSSVNRNDISVVCPFSSEDFEDCLAVASDSQMAICAMDEIQKLHIRQIPLGEQPRRICHSMKTGTFAVVTCLFHVDESTGGEEIETNYVRLVDDQSFDILDGFALEDFEQGISATRCIFQSDEETDYFVVGTAFALEDEPEPSRGRILVLQVVGGQRQSEDGGEIAVAKRLELVAQVETAGAVYSLNSFNGLLLAGINSKIQLYDWCTSETSGGGKELKSKCGLHGHILALHVTTQGDYIVVGDLMKSISLCVYKPLEGMIEEVARDFNANWMTAVGIVDDETFIGAEHAYNLFVAKRNSNAKTEEDRSRLEIVGEYHLGEFVNCFRDGSLVMQPTEVTKAPGDVAMASAEHVQMDIVDTSKTDVAVASSVASIRPKMLFATVLGSIGALATLTKDQFELLKRLQNALNEVIHGVGGFSHNHWRAFCNERNIPDSDGASKNFIDGDLIERYLDLDKERMDQIALHLRNGKEGWTEGAIDADGLSKMVEELQRLH